MVNDVGGWACTLDERSRRGAATMGDVFLMDIGDALGRPLGYAGPVAASVRRMTLRAHAQARNAQQYSPTA